MLFIDVHVARTYAVESSCVVLTVSHTYGNAFFSTTFFILFICFPSLIAPILVAKGWQEVT